MKKILLIIILLYACNNEETVPMDRCHDYVEDPKTTSKEFARIEAELDLSYFKNPEPISLYFPGYSIMVMSDASWNTVRMIGWGSRIKGPQWHQYYSLSQPENDFNYQVITRLAADLSLKEFKQRLISMLSCQYAKFEIINEGNDFIEYITEDKYFYHGFVIGIGLYNNEELDNHLISQELIGSSLLENKLKFENKYKEIFETNRKILENIIIKGGFNPLI